MQSKILVDLILLVYKQNRKILLFPFHSQIFIISLTRAFALCTFPWLFPQQWDSMRGTGPMLCSPARENSVSQNHNIKVVRHYTNRGFWDGFKATSMQKFTILKIAFLSHSAAFWHQQGLRQTLEVVHLAQSLCRSSCISGNNVPVLQTCCLCMHL